MLADFDTVMSGTTLEPRPYQMRITTKARDMFLGHYKDENTGDLQKPMRSILIESPTGSGKTSMALLSCRMLQHTMPDLVVGWVAMRRNLLAQAERENHEKSIGVQNIHFISMFDKSPDVLIEARKQGKKVLVVSDEAQHDAANSMAHLHNVVEPDYILGMTATPFRTDRVKLCFDKIIKDAGIHALIQDGYLSQYEHYTISDWQPRTVADTYLRDPKRWGKSIFYFKNVQECYELAQILRSSGVMCDVVTGDTDCESQLEAFRSGVYPCLINCMKLTEGFDEPALETAWVRPSRKGPTMQMGGRVFRKHPEAKRDPKYAVKRIVQSKDSKWPFIRTALPVQQYSWQEDTWLSLTVNPHLNEINQSARRAIAAAEVALPDMLAVGVGLKRRPVRRFK